MKFVLEALAAVAARLGFESRRRKAAVAARRAEVEEMRRKRADAARREMEGELARLDEELR